MAAGRIQLYSTGLDAAGHDLTGVERIRSVRDAVLDSVAASGEREIAVIPEGPYVVPVYQA
jgi:hypothetical protein